MLEAVLPLFLRFPFSRSYHAARRLSRAVRNLKSFIPESSVRLGKPVDSDHGRDLHNEQYVVRCSAITFVLRGSAYFLIGNIPAAPAIPGTGINPSTRIS